MQLFINLFLIFVGLGESYNILVVFPFKGKSHFLIYEKFFERLATKGHNLTVISNYPKKNLIQNYLDVPINAPSAANKLEFMSISDLQTSSGIKWINILGLMESFYEDLCTNAFETEAMKEFLRKDNQFDLILMNFFLSECFTGLVEKYDAPFIGLVSNLLFPWHYEWLGSPDNPAYMPEFSVEVSSKMNFFERLENTLCHIYNLLGYKYLLIPTANKYSKKYLGFDLEKNYDIFYNTSLVLVPTHYSTYGAVPYVPNIIEVGGIQINEPTPLPKFFSDYINESKDGVIYFSMGSTLKGTTFPKEKRDAFLKNFAKLPQRVIWKWENETMDDKPDNVLLSRWTPQFDIICDPNVKAFIYQGGLLSSSEALYCGIPQIILPQFADQFRNAQSLQSAGVAVTLKLKDVTEESVEKALQEVLKPEFQVRVKEFAERYKDRPLKPLDTAVYWVEYVARHKGAHFMKSAAVKMPLYQYLLLDVIAFILLVLTVLLLVLYYLFKKIFSFVLKLLSNKKKVE